MLSLLYIVVFIFCVAITIACILIAHEFISTYNTTFHKNYHYYLITFFGFAFYAIWAQVLMRVLLLSLNTTRPQIEMIANFMPILGIPFLIISWVMLLKMGYSLVSTPIKKNLVQLHFLILLMLIPLVWGCYILLDKGDMQFSQNLSYLPSGSIVLIELIYVLLFLKIIYNGVQKQNGPNKKILNKFAWLMLLGIILRITIVPFLFSNPWVLAPFILIYFLSNFIPLFYLRLNSDLVFTPIHAENPIEEKKALIYKKYKITKREKEIVEQICKGKTNQQIADELFISLQTVKDHTHRIYTKIGIKGRMKLVQLVNG